MTKRLKCQNANCVCVDCTSVNKHSDDLCKKYCETVCRGHGQPMYPISDNSKCPSFHSQSRKAV